MILVCVHYVVLDNVVCVVSGLRGVVCTDEGRSYEHAYLLHVGVVVSVYVIEIMYVGVIMHWSIDRALYMDQWTVCT